MPNIEPEEVPKILPLDLLSALAPKKGLDSAALLVEVCPSPPKEKSVFPPNRLPPEEPDDPEAPNNDPLEAPEEGWPKLKPDIVSLWNTLE